MIKYHLPDLCRPFQKLVQSYPQVLFFQPSPDKAPWHVQAVFNTANSDPIVLNFWPHKDKGQRQPMPAVEGIDALFRLVEEAIKDAETEEPFDVIEDCA